MALIKCPECNNDISDRADICPHCGYPLTGWDEYDEENTYESAIICPECNQPIYDDAESCPYCGYPLVDYESNEMQDYTEEYEIEEKNPLWLDILIAILLFFTPTIPVGIVLMWVKKWPREIRIRIIATIIFGAIFLFSAFVNPYRELSRSSNASNTSTSSIINTAKSTSTMTMGQRNALAAAKNYLSFTSFSRDGLINQLELFDKYSNEDATFAADNCGADWYEQALIKSKEYFSFESFSYNGLIHQLEFENFTTEEATYAADHCGADWNEQAAKKARSYLSFSSFSRDGLIDQLEYEGFTTEQAAYGVEANGY